MEKKIFWIGENSNPVKKDRLNDYIMDSVINYITIDSPELPYKAKHVFLDNGAFTARTQNLTLDPFKILDLQEKLSPSKVIPLDFPFLPVDTIVKMKITKNFSSENHFFGDRQPTKDLIEMLSNAISRTQELTDFKTHVLGIGSSPLMLNIIYYLGAESTDSAGARRKAAYGKIVLPGRGERYLGDGTASFGRNKKSDKKQRQQILDELKNSCSCEICRNNPNLLETDWKARAIHNEHVLKKEVETIQRLMSQGIDVLERYMEGIFEKSSFNYLYKFAKQKKRYHNICTLI